MYVKLIKGPTPPTWNLLDDLSARNVKATFFWVGANVLDYPDRVKRAFDEGHQICSHSWYHFAETSLSTEQVVTSIEWTLRAIADVTGIRPKCHRPPFGDYDDRIRAIVKAMGLQLILWNYDTNDWLLNAGENIDVVGDAKRYARKWDQRSDGVVSLAHDRTVETASKGAGMIDAIISQGMVPMSIEQCLNSGTSLRKRKSIRT